MIRAELDRLLTVRSTYAASLAALTFAVALAVAGLAPDDDIREMSAMAAYPAAILGFACAHALGEEFRSGVLAPTLVARPERTRLLAAKSIVAAGFGLAVGTVMAGAMVLVAALWLAHFDLPFDFDVAGFVVSSALVTAGFAVAGTGAGALARRPGVATATLAALYLALSGLLGRNEALGFWNDHGIGAVMFDLLENGPTPGPAALNAAYALALLGAGVLAVRRADL